MLKKFFVKNYKNFENEICLDFSSVGGYKFNEDCIKDNIITKYFIYGRNSVGKSNLGRAIMKISSLFFPSSRNIENIVLLNANSNDLYSEFRYVFDFSGNELDYRFSLDESNKLVKESLYLNDNLIFNIDKINKKFDLGTIKRINVKKELFENYKENITHNTDDIDNNLNSSFLKMAITNSVLEKDSILILLYAYVSKMVFLDVRNQKIISNSQLDFFKLLAKNNNLDNFEKFLNQMGVDCKLASEETPDGKNHIYFKEKKLIPFYENASSGTLGLTKLYELLSYVGEPSLLIFDEFDAFYHYEMSSNVVKYLKENKKNTQVLFTTHNTNLMDNEILRPDCIAILSSFGTLTPLCKATNRELREGHNLEKLYIGGEFSDYE